VEVDAAARPPRAPAPPGRPRLSALALAQARRAPRLERQAEREPGLGLERELALALALQRQALRMRPQGLTGERVELPAAAARSTAPGAQTPQVAISPKVAAEQPEAGG
jgi:hypothetical protein